MGLLDFTHAVSFKVLHCYKCGVLFGMPLDVYNCRLADGKDFWCIHGHEQHFVESKVAKLEKELETEKKRLEWQRARAARAERQTAAAKGQLTKLKNRVKHGVCPCCNRTFRNVMAHMKTKHPDFEVTK